MFLFIHSVAFIFFLILLYSITFQMDRPVIKLSYLTYYYELEREIFQRAFFCYQTFFKSQSNHAENSLIKVFFIRILHNHKPQCN